MLVLRIRDETFTVDTGIYYENIKMYTHTYMHTPNIDNFTGVQASGVIIVYCDSAVSYGPKL